MAINEGLLIFGEIVDGEIVTSTKELLNLGRRLGNLLGQKVNALLIGKDIEEKANELIKLGADNVYIVNGTQFTNPSPDLYLAIITEVCKELESRIILLSNTDMGRDVAPRLSVRLNGVVTLDCTDLYIHEETKRLVQVKPVYGGNAIAHWVSELGVPQIITIRPRSVMPSTPDQSRKGDIIKLNISIGQSMIKAKLIETVKEDIRGVKLEDAKVIVGGGGGIGGVEGFKLLEELAKVLRGAVGVSRVPCDEGWMPLSLEIGQTGHIVTPNLYIAIGISGAPQHMVGCAGSKYIVAINRDPEAQIFKEVNYGLVGDYREILPAFIEKCRELVK